MLRCDQSALSWACLCVILLLSLCFASSVAHISTALAREEAEIANPLNYGRACPLTFERFQSAFANAVDETEAHERYDTYSVPGSGVPLFQAAAANLNPWTETRVETKNSERGPPLIVEGERDHTVPPVIAHAAVTPRERNTGVTEYHEMPGRGHSLTIDHGWRDVAEMALAFLARHARKAQ